MQELKEKTQHHPPCPTITSLELLLNIQPCTFIFPKKLIVQSMRPTRIFKIFPEFMVREFWPRNFEYAIASFPIWSGGTKAQWGAFTMGTEIVT